MREQHLDYAGIESSSNKHRVWDICTVLFQIQMNKYLLSQEINFLKRPFTMEHLQLTQLQGMQKYRLLLKISFFSIRIIQMNCEVQRADQRPPPSHPEQIAETKWPSRASVSSSPCYRLHRFFWLIYLEQYHAQHCLF